MMQWRPSAGEVALLERVYEHEQTPCRESREQLAAHLSVSSRQVQAWFQNKRRRVDPRAVAALREEALSCVKRLWQQQQLEGSGGGVAAEASGEFQFEVEPIDIDDAAAAACLKGLGQHPTDITNDVQRPVTSEIQSEPDSEPPCASLAPEPADAAPPESVGSPSPAGRQLVAEPAQNTSLPTAEREPTSFGEAHQINGAYLARSAGPRFCVRCGTTDTPRWRCNKTLCNACGLRDKPRGLEGRRWRGGSIAKRHVLSETIRSSSRSVVMAGTFATAVGAPVSYAWASEAQDVAWLAREQVAALRAEAAAAEAEARAEEARYALAVTTARAASAAAEAVRLGVWRQAVPAYFNQVAMYRSAGAGLA